VTGDACARHALAPLRRPYPRKQFADAEGFGEIVIGAGAERPDLFLLVDAGGQDDDWQDWSRRKAKIWR
jgi:hypothetical protein